VLTNLYELMQGVRNLDAVTVCRCGEYALGGGLELAMSCDFSRRDRGRRARTPGDRRGLVTGIQGGLLVRLVGLQAAKEITGEPVSGLDAEELRLVNRAVAPDAYVETVDHLVETLASKSPRIIQWQTQVFRALRSNGVESGIDHSLETIAACFDTYQQEAMTHPREPGSRSFQGGKRSGDPNATTETTQPFIGRFRRTVHAEVIRRPGRRRDVRERNAHGDEIGNRLVRGTVRSAAVFTSTKRRPRTRCSAVSRQRTAHAQSP